MPQKSVADIFYPDGCTDRLNKTLTNSAHALKVTSTEPDHISLCFTKTTEIFC